MTYQVTDSRVMMILEYAPGFFYIYDRDCLYLLKAGYLDKAPYSCNTCQHLRLAEMTQQVTDSRVMMILDYAPEFFMFMTEIVSICLKQGTQIKRLTHAALASV